MTNTPAAERAREPGAKRAKKTSGATANTSAEEFLRFEDELFESVSLSLVVPYSRVLLLSAMNHLVCQASEFSYHVPLHVANPVTELDFLPQLAVVMVLKRCVYSTLPAITRLT